MSLDNFVNSLNGINYIYALDQLFCNAVATVDGFGRRVLKVTYFKDTVPLSEIENVIMRLILQREFVDLGEEEKQIGARLVRYMRGYFKVTHEQLKVASLFQKLSNQFLEEYAEEVPGTLNINGDFDKYFRGEEVALEEDFSDFEYYLNNEINDDQIMLK